MPRIKRKGYKLVFRDDSPLDGCTVVMGSLTADEFMVISKGMAASPAAAAGETGDEVMEAVGDMLDMTAAKIRSWDLEEDDDDPNPGAPIPATREGLGSLDFDMSMAILKAWTDAMVTVSAPLPAGSSSGGTPLEMSIPMTPVADSSPSLAS